MWCMGWQAFLLGHDRRFLVLAAFTTLEGNDVICVTLVAASGVSVLAEQMAIRSACILRWHGIRNHLWWTMFFFFSA